MSDETQARRNKPGAGPPSKYKLEFNQMLIDHMEQGHSFRSFGGVIGVCEDTLHDWAKRHPDFKIAKDIAFSKCVLFIEKRLQDLMVNEIEYDDQGKAIKSRTVNQAIAIFYAKNIAGMRDKFEDEKDEININLTLADKLAKARNRASKK